MKFTLAVALVTKRKRPRVIAPTKAYERLIEVTCVTWHLARAYLTSYGGERISARDNRKKPDIPLEEALHLREMRKHSGFTSHHLTNIKL